MLYVRTFQQIVSRIFVKDMIFYEEGKWYSRYHSGYISQQELMDWILELTKEEDSIYE